jgi:hypothetical protein
MRRAKVTGYQHRSRGHGVRFGIFRLLDFVSMMIRGLVPLLPFIIIGVLFVLPKSPHLRVSYTYTGSYDSPHYITCRYLGIHGWVRVYGSQCPMITLMNGKPIDRDALRTPDESHRASLPEYREIW